MKINTRIFGEIDIDEQKIIHFVNGIIGFPDMKDFTLIFDEEKKDEKSIIWLQSLDDVGFAMPLMNPLIVNPKYDPTVEDELLQPLGTLKPENTMCLVTVTIPRNIEQISINLKAPIIINADERKASQLIIEDDLPVKYPIYEFLAKKEGE